MNKELLITLIDRDIADLKMLTKGFSAMDNLPEAIIELAVSKAQNIVDCLQKLPLYVEKTEKIAEQIIKKQEKKEIILVEPAVEEPPAQDGGQQPFFEEKIEKKEPDIEEKPVKTVVVEEKPVKTVVVEPKKVKEKPVKIIADKHEKTEVKLEEKPAPIVADQSKASFSIADRFRFSRELFNGNVEQYLFAVSKFNEMETLNEAKNYIEKNMKWDLENPVVQEFIGILERKYNIISNI
ncbi:MAG: hypothetical protein LBS50_02970 [Prevotellaceae bacterium]|jgi:hypothetical protein|nr:hypothetical protein [Prevotellaceae bacterium]